MLYFSVGVCVNRKERSALESFAPNVIFIRHPRNEKRTGAAMRPPIVSEIVLGHAPVSYWPIILPVPSNSPRRLCERQLGPSFLHVLRAAK